MLEKHRFAMLAEKYQLAMLRLGAKDSDFIACGITPPTAQERPQAKAEGWLTPEQLEERENGV